MKISLNWLKEYLDYSSSVEELTAIVTVAGMEVVSVETRGAGFPRVVVAQILDSSPHPNAERLSICRVSDGSEFPRQIVCGAKNYKAGDKVALALPGAVLPGGVKIKAGKLRGVDSEGMLCSAKELSIAEDAAGLLILRPDATVGTPISAIFPPDAVLEIEITPNRPDWLSHFGVAREVAAFTCAALRPIAIPTPIARPIPSVAQIDDVAGCPFYTVRRIRGIKAGPSPEWLRTRLEAVGLRPINCIVDVTNYVMFELGQPLHAFDAAKFAGGIVIRRAQEGERLVALDGNAYTLDERHLVIADGAKPTALAGIMGGEESSVAESTTDVLLESAYFEQSLIRRTSRELGISSDSSYRFERGVDPAGVLAASARATQLILEIAGGEADEWVTTAGAVPEAKAEVTLQHDRCHRLLGVTFSDAKISEALSSLGMELVHRREGETTWRIPSYRGDLRRDVDLIEEVIRIAGIDAVPGRMRALFVPASEADRAYDFCASLRARLKGQGFYEARTSTLVSSSSIDDRDVLAVKNPLGEEQSVLRPSLIPALLEAVHRNLNHGARTVRLFELGRVFKPGANEEASTLAMVMTGSVSPVHWRRDVARELDFFDLKGVLSTLSSAIAFEPMEHPVYPLALRINFGSAPVGLAAQIPPATARKLDARSSIVFAELEVWPLLEAAPAMVTFQPIAKFPSVARDVAVVAEKNLPYAAIERCITSAGEPLLASVEPFDVFSDPSGERLPPNRKSVAISLTFRSPERTLTGEEVNAACERLKDRLRATLQVEIRE